LLPKEERRTGPHAYIAPSAELDGVNRRLLVELQNEPRMSISRLARRVGMSAPAVTERVQRLEATGVISGYRMDVDPRAIGLPVTAFARVRPAPGQLPRCMDVAREIPQIVECYRITGEDCLLVKLHAPNIEGIEEILDRFLTYAQTSTSIVVSSPVPQRPLPLV
jgi:Lrp/AsnC family leucine-responsive transcriptional regulator